MMMMSLLDGSGMTGDIWSTGAFALESPLKDLLDSGTFTLEQLLAEDELLQELRGLHPQLLDYFSTEEVVTKLVQYLILDLEKHEDAATTAAAAAATDTSEESGSAAAAAAAVVATTPKDDTVSSEESPGISKAFQPPPVDDVPDQDSQSAEGRGPGSGAEEEKEGDDGALKPESGRWLIEQTSEPVEDNGKEKHPERNPDNKYIRFPFMACEIICCELQGVINVLVDGFVPVAGSDKISESPAENNASIGEGTATSDKTSGSSEKPLATSDVPADSSAGPQSSAETATIAQRESRQRILDLLMSVLYKTDVGKLDDYRAGYLEKIMNVLFRKRPQAMSEYMNTGGCYGKLSLMKAMFKHLYSHSIMQLVQRLLLPQPQHLQQNAEVDEDGDNKDGDEDDDGNLIIAPQPGMSILDDADDESKLLKCDWSESGEALDLLLQPLIHPNAFPSNHTTEDNHTINGAEIELSEEERLNFSQNSSEVLITIIQNSPLNSETMLRLTVDPIIELLVDSASSLKAGDDFSHHESNLTAAMNVLESLILQLGGYGSVGTISLLPPEENENEGEGGSSEGTEEKPPPPQFADLKFLLNHIPRLLESLSKLLHHPSCERWLSPMQYSNPSEPQRLLGMSRLRMVRLLESLVLLGDSNVDSLLCQSDCLEYCLDLFWKFQWCSMLHQSVANLLVHVFEGANARSKMQEYFLVRCNLLGRLMDSFAESIPNEHSFGLRDDAPNPEFSEQEVVISMKDINMESQNAPVNAPQPNDLGARIDDEVGRTPGDKVFPVSDDDIDASLEQQNKAGTTIELTDLKGRDLLKDQRPQDVSVNSVGQVSTEAVRFESRDASTVGAILDGAPPQSFRLGYMGHVIIICQALVHACSTENEEEPENTAPDSTMADEEDEARMSLIANSDQENAKSNGEDASDSVLSPPPREAFPTVSGQEDAAGRDDGECARAGDNESEGVTPTSQLMLSKLIESHPLQNRWHEFVRTTLATETSIQSTPLGGYNNSPHLGGDPLHAHRPLGDDDDFDDGSGQPNMPPRGMLGGGDVLDLDENDLDIAASMMAGLHLGRGGKNVGDVDDNESDDDEGGSNGSGNTYDENAAKGGYYFDDPLGNKRESGLGLALGNLRQYNAAGSSDEEEEEDEEGSDQSSTEEEQDAPLRRQISNGDDVPVMNLFAGNMPADEEKLKNVTPFEEDPFGDFANFDANFDDAFANGGVDAGSGFAANFGTESSGSTDSTPNGDPFSSPAPVANALVDDIFGGPKPHAILLDDEADDNSNPKGSTNPSATDNAGANKNPEATAAPLEEPLSPEDEGFTRN